MSVIRLVLILQRRNQLEIKRKGLVSSYSYVANKTREYFNYDSSNGVDPKVGLAGTSIGVLRLFVNHY